MVGELVQQIKQARKESILSGFAKYIGALSYNTQKAYLTDLVVFFREMFPEHWKFHKKFNPVALDVAVQYVVNELEEQAKFLPELRQEYKKAVPAIRKIASSIKHRHGLQPIIRQEGNILLMNLNPVPVTSLAELIDANTKDIALVETVFRENINYLGADFFSHIFDVEAIGSVLGHLRNYHANSNNTLVRKIASLKRFELYLEEIGLVNRIMMHKVPKPYVKRNEQIYLEYDELVNLIKSVENKRDKAIFYCLFGLGLRASELCDLKINDYTGDQMIVRKGKGGRQRTQEVGPNTKKYLDEYLQERKGIYKEIKDDCLFLSYRSGIRLGREDIFRLVIKYAEKSGIQKKINAHSVRRTVATHFNETGGSLIESSDWLGHLRLETTKTYVGITQKSRRIHLKRCHPEA